MKRCFLVLLCIIIPVASARGASDFRIDQEKGTDLIRVSLSTASGHKLEIDDASAFRTPLIAQVFTGSSVQFHANDAALIPGVDYFVRLDGRVMTQPLRLEPGSYLTEPRANCQMLRTTWEENGRLRTGVAFSSSLGTCFQAMGIDTAHLPCREFHIQRRTVSAPSTPRCPRLRRYANPG